MSGQLSIFGLTTSPDSTNATSLPGSASGLAPSATPSAPSAIAFRARFSPDRRHVSRFRSLESDKAMSTNDTSGPLFTASSIHAALQRSLENRLRARMGGNGWPLFGLTWRPADMPSGPPSCQLQASARRISATGCSGWPTPTTRDHKDGSKCPNVPLNALLARWRGWRAGRRRARRTGTGDKFDESESHGQATGRLEGDGGAGVDCEVGGVADAVRQVAGSSPCDEAEDGRARRDRSEPDGDNIAASHGEDCRPGPVNGVWRNADWLYCRDGKWRPVEPGLFPLVDGASFKLGSGSANEGKSRSGMLRGAGNAICLPVAVAFVWAAIEAIKA